MLLSTTFLPICQPHFLFTLYIRTVASSWRDIKVIGHYAYIGSEANDHGLQVPHVLHLVVHYRPIADMNFL